MLQNISSNILIKIVSLGIHYAQKIKSIKMCNVFDDQLPVHRDDE